MNDDRHTPFDAQLRTSAVSRLIGLRRHSAAPLETLQFPQFDCRGDEDFLARPLPTAVTRHVPDDACLIERDGTKEAAMLRVARAPSGGRVTSPRPAGDGRIAGCAEN